MAADQQDLLPALSFLLRSRAMASALAQPSGRDDGRIAARLLAEVEAQYSPAICQRLQGVIQGMVGMPERQAPHPSPAWSPVPPAQAVVNQPAVTTLVTTSSSGSSWVVALLCFLIGIVGSGLLLLLWQQQQQQGKQAVNVSATPPAPTNPPEPQPSSPVAPASEPSAAPAGTAAIDAAVASIQELYAALSAKDYASASNHYGGQAADQFDPTFFNQFERVTVADLRQTSSAGSTMNFEGVVTFVYPNGDVQTESRSFTMDTRTTPVLITSSEFGRVLQPRRG
ncbi:hypothetical protein [Vulcanococcus limneticus]|uniref:hypothetical protein n=1 Tax=Vulcanococcus limneticus TaxID=2170428 RepID=UPI00398C00B7